MNNIEVEIRTIDNDDYLIIDGKVFMRSSKGIKAQDILEELESAGYIILKFTEE